MKNKLIFSGMFTVTKALWFTLYGNTNYNGHSRPCTLHLWKKCLYTR